VSIITKQKQKKLSTLRSFNFANLFFFYRFFTQIAQIYKIKLPYIILYNIFGFDIANLKSLFEIQAGIFDTFFQSRFTSS